MALPEFCVEAKCTKIAIAAHRSRKHCREHYVKFVEPHLVAAKVIAAERGAKGEVPGVAGPDGVTVRAPGIVRLDPEETSLAALVAAGLIEIAADEVDKLKKAS